MVKVKSKLYRNLKPGDKFIVMDLTYTLPRIRTAVVTVSRVHETRREWFSGKRQWAVHGDYPWWFTGPIHAYSDDRTELV